LNVSQGVGIPRSKALEYFSFLQGVGIKGELAGSAFKGGERHAVVHDIDIVVRASDWEACYLAIMALQGEPPVNLEFYVAEEGCFERLLVALRASRYEVIKYRLMEGCRFKKHEWNSLKED
jgi:hypothetical protein